METDMSLTMCGDVFNMKEALQNLGFVSSERVKEFSYTVADSREQNVWLSPHKYWCFIEDERFENEYAFKFLTPYCWQGYGETLYGWVDGVNFVDNDFGSIHLDPDRVTMFLPHV